eukprot:1836204-Prymnesium_polylepis.1
MGPPVDAPSFLRDARTVMAHGSGQFECDARIERSVPGSIPQQRLYESPRCGCVARCTSGGLRCPVCPIAGRSYPRRQVVTKLKFGF